MSSSNHSFIETLEGRRLLAAQMFDVAPITVVNPTFGVTVTEPATKAKPVAEGTIKKKKGAVDAPIVRSTDLTGEWTGRVKVRFGFFSKKFDLDLSIYTQDENSISGRIEVDGHDYSGVLHGKINPKNGRFRFELDDDGDEITIKGQLGKRGQIIGGGKIEVDYDGWDIKGSFEVDRIG